MRILVVNSGSSSLKLRVLDEHDELVGLGGPAGDRHAGRRRPRNPQARRRCGPRSRASGRSTRSRTGRPRRPEFARAGPGRRHGGREAEALAELAPLHQPRSMAALRVVRAILPERAARGVLRHGVPPRAVGGGGHVCAPAGVARALAAPALWLPRAVPRLHRAARAELAGRARGPPHRELPSRRRGVARCHSRRPLHRYDDGLHAARGPGHGDALRRRRSRPRPVAAAARRALGRGGRRRAGAPIRAAGPRRARTTCATCSLARWPAPQRHSSPATSTCTGCGPDRRDGGGTGRPGRLVFTAGVGEHSRGDPGGRRRAARLPGLELDAAANGAGTADREVSASGSRREHPRHRGAGGSGDGRERSFVLGDEQPA